MVMRDFLTLMLLAGSVRFAVLVWNGYRTGRVKSASPWGQYVDRTAQSRLYSTIMAMHTLVVVALVGCSVALAFGWAPIRSSDTSHSCRFGQAGSLYHHNGVTAEQTVQHLKLLPCSTTDDLAHQPVEWAAHDPHRLAGTEHQLELLRRHIGLVEFVQRAATP
jgi:hypothetical protein